MKNIIIITMLFFNTSKVFARKVECTGSYQTRWIVDLSSGKVWYNIRSRWDTEAAPTELPYAPDLVVKTTRISPTLISFGVVDKGYEVYTASVIWLGAYESGRSGNWVVGSGSEYGTQCRDI